MKEFLQLTLQLGARAFRDLEAAKVTRVILEEPDQQEIPELKVLMVSLDPKAKGVALSTGFRVCLEKAEKEAGEGQMGQKVFQENRTS
ncbi:hypothetical protein TYRP_018833 [Tyrophagus putrescentiae]|nr:hypothetical protein TYRP_018833 [Tyrophagus putrescentiae]